MGPGLAGRRTVLYMWPAPRRLRDGDLPGQGFRLGARFRAGVGSSSGGVTLL